VTSPEQEWLRQAQNGDDDAFAALVELYQKPVYNLCYRMLGSDAQEAEDAAQETFWRAYQAIKRYDTRRSFVTWLLSIAAHYCIDQQRKKRLPVTEMDEVLEETAPDPYIPNPEHSAAQSETQRSMQQLLSTLPPQDRAVIVLRYWHELSEEEISRSLNMTTSAVKSRLHRARLKLAQQWQETAGEYAALERI
jgi:RNA polymerase sigma-70 factor (ECF subfamily)